MTKPLQSEIVKLPSIFLHYIAYTKQKPTLLLLHGLTANAFAFQGLIEAGLTKKYEVLSVDLRGRGQSQQPAYGYTIKEHAQDVIALLDHLQIKEIALCGHSFGGLLSSYLAYHFPERFTKIIILDAAPQMNPRVAEMLGPALARLDKHFKSFDQYLEEIKNAPYMNFWDDAMLPYYKADVITDKDGKVESICDLAQIIQISTYVGMEPWTIYFEGLTQSCTICAGTHDYTLNEALLPPHLAQRIVHKMKKVNYVEIAGNHHTMLYQDGAKQIVAAM
jgi:pimeloyl-ACP methyl ester carboxylesterase